ncbi:hypothetical protein [Hyphomicrobium sp. ghe19]|uniref:hypothetical protein n=1 Tax=Hyphomicrobium sp. ghe19 TaxID=2682968 RepID=UPI001366D015|nr:hypothetical protein HYPP_01487 [Hyphomicrobium sp. ghe19]
MLNKLLGRTEGHQAQGASWRDAVPNAEKTEPPAGLLASVRKLPLDVAAKSAKRANDRLTTAEAELMRAEIALEQVRKENQEREDLHLSYVEKRANAVTLAAEELGKAQMHFLREAQDCGALERTGPLVDLLNGLRETKDDDKVPTVRVDIE